MKSSRLILVMHKRHEMETLADKQKLLMKSQPETCACPPMSQINVTVLLLYAWQVSVCFVISEERLLHTDRRPLIERRIRITTRTGRTGQVLSTSGSAMGVSLLVRESRCGIGGFSAKQSTAFIGRGAQ